MGTLIKFKNRSVRLFMLIKPHKFKYFVIGFTITFENPNSCSIMPNSNLQPIANDVYFIVNHAMMMTQL